MCFIKLIERKSPLVLINMMWMLKNKKRDKD